MPQRRGQRKKNRSKKRQASKDADAELDPFSLSNEDELSPFTLPAQSAAVPGLAEWYLCYGRYSSALLSEDNLRLVLGFGTDDAFDDKLVTSETSPFASESASEPQWSSVGLKYICEGVAFERKKVGGRLTPVQPFDRAAAVGMLQSVQHAVKCASTAHLEHMNSATAHTAGSSSPAWVASAASRLEGCLLLPHDEHLQGDEVDTRMDLNAHMVGCTIADAMDSMHVAAALRLMHQRINARCAAGELSLQGLTRPPNMSAMPKRIQELENLAKFAARWGPGLFADALSSCFWLGVLVSTLSRALQSLQFVVGLLRRFKAATWHENQAEAPKEYRCSDLSSLLSDVRSLLSHLQRTHDLLLRCNAQEHSNIAQTRRYASIMHSTGHAVDDIADSVDDAFEAALASATPPAPQPDVDCLDGWAAPDASLAKLAPDLHIHGYSAFEAPSVGAGGSQSGEDTDSSADEEHMFVQQLLYFRQQYRQEGQPETHQEAEMRTRCSTGPHTALRNLAWRPGGERGLLRTERLRSMLAKLLVVLPEVDELSKGVAALFCKHAPLLVACDFQFRSVLLHIQRSPGGTGALQLWRRSNMLSLFTEMLPVWLLADLTWVQCFNRAVEEQLQSDDASDSLAQELQRDLQEGEMDKQAMCAPTVHVQGGIIGPLLDAAPQLAVQGLPGAKHLLPVQQKPAGSATAAVPTEATRESSQHELAPKQSKLKLPSALTKLASPSQLERLHTALPPLFDVLFSPKEAAEFLRELQQCRSQAALEAEIASIESTVQEIQGGGAPQEGAPPQALPVLAASSCSALLAQDMACFTPAALQAAQTRVEVAVKAVCAAGVGPEMPYRIAWRPELAPLRAHKRHAPPRARADMYEPKATDLTSATDDLLLLPGMLGEVSEEGIKHCCANLKDDDVYSLESLEPDMWQVGPDRLMQSCAGALQDWQEHQNMLVGVLLASATNWMSQQPLGAGVAMRQRASLTALHRFNASSSSKLGHLTDAIASAFKQTIALQACSEDEGLGEIAAWLTRTTGLQGGCELAQTKEDLLQCAKQMGLSPEDTTQLLYTHAQEILADRLTCSSRALRALLLHAAQRALVASHYEALAVFLDFELVLCTQMQRLPLLTAGTRGANADSAEHARLAAAAGISQDNFKPWCSLPPVDQPPGVLSSAMSAQGSLDAASCLLARQATAALRAWWAAAVPNAHAAALQAEEQAQSKASTTQRSTAGASAETATTSEQGGSPPECEDSPSIGAQDGGHTKTAGQSEMVDASLPHASGGTALLAQLGGGQGDAHHDSQVQHAPPSELQATGEGEAAPLDSSWIEALLSSAVPADGDGTWPAMHPAEASLPSSSLAGAALPQWQDTWQPDTFGIDLGGGGMWLNSSTGVHTTPAFDPDDTWREQPTGDHVASRLPPPPGLPPAPAPLPPAEQPHDAVHGTSTPKAQQPEVQALLRFFTPEQVQALARVHTTCSPEARKLAAAAAVGAAQAVMQASNQ